MIELPRSALVSTLLRSFAIQATWNYRTLIGCGFAFAMLPMLRTIYANRPAEYRAAVRRHTQIFNSHPYFAPMALGAVTVLETEESAEVVDRFKSAVRGSLGSLGDRLVWAGFRPLCLLLAMAGVMLGFGWALVVAGFLVLYNVGHVATRIWALHFGLSHGRRLGEKLRGAPVERIEELLQSAGAFALGLVCVLVLGGRLVPVRPDFLWVAAGAAAVALGMRFAGRTRWPLVIVFTGIALVSVTVGVMR